MKFTKIRAAIAVTTIAAIAVWGAVAVTVLHGTPAAACNNGGC